LEDDAGAGMKQMNKTETWLLRPSSGREHLGKVLADMGNTTQKRRVLQTIGQAFPTQAKLHLWKLSSTALCPFCKSGSETLSHVQCWCPSLAEARIKAHHLVWRAVWDKLTEQRSSEWTFAMELTAQKMTDLPADPGYQHVRAYWQRCLHGLDDTVLQPTDPAHEALTALTHLSNTLGSCTAGDAATWLQVILQSEACTLHDMAGTLLLAEVCSTVDPIVAQIHREMNALQQQSCGLMRKRPDGTAVNWAQKKVYLLEYTRAFDMHKDALKRTDDVKAARYKPLLTVLLGALGDGWTGSVLTFSTGVCGSVDANVWDMRLELLGMPKATRTSTIQDAVTASIQALDIVYTARSAARHAH
jgi:hypothetical protein